jgi:uncharacterized membrane protein YbhN (UPF0104 family)
VLAQYLDLLHRARWLYIVCAVAVYLVSVLLTALRWQTMIAGVRRAPRAPLGPLRFGSLAAVFVNNVMPGPRVAGEACRVIVLQRLGLASLGQAATAAAYERLSELPAVALLAIAALEIVGHSIGGRSLSRAVPIATLALVGVAVAWRPLARRWQELATRWTLLGAATVLPSAFGAAAALSGTIWLLDVARIRIVAAAFGAPLGVAQTAALSAITIVAGWVPTVGGLGAVEGGLMAGLVGFGVPGAEAVAIVAVERAISFGVGTALGCASLWALGGRGLWRAIRSRVQLGKAAHENCV